MGKKLLGKNNKAYIISICILLIIVVIQNIFFYLNQNTPFVAIKAPDELYTIPVEIIKDEFKSIDNIQFIVSNYWEPVTKEYYFKKTEVDKYSIYFPKNVSETYEICFKRFTDGSYRAYFVMSTGHMTNGNFLRSVSYDTLLERSIFRSSFSVKRINVKKIILNFNFNYNNLSEWENFFENIVILLE